MTLPARPGEGGRRHHVQRPGRKRHQCRDGLSRGLRLCALESGRAELWQAERVRLACPSRSDPRTVDRGAPRRGARRRRLERVAVEILEGVFPAVCAQRPCSQDHHGHEGLEVPRGLICASRGPGGRCRSVPPLLFSPDSTGGPGKALWGFGPPGHPTSPGPGKFRLECVFLNSDPVLLAT